ncbi:MAG TPA: PfkB family carbohydrate kinase [Bacillota bacterium]|nr:PfkB family carbohydrate kinase [Bacillota bacterium]HOL10601.1 PfkB family carbohydrate kinase [Bacillota bacterium]
MFNSNSFLTISLNPTLQKTLVFRDVKLNEVNRCTEQFLDVSGKGINVSRVLLQLNEAVNHLTPVGGRDRELFLSLAAQDGIQCYTVDSGIDIRWCYTMIDLNNNTTTEMIETTNPVSEETENKIWQLFEKLLAGSHTVIITGTKASGFSDAIYPKMVQAAKHGGKRVILDLKGADLVNCLTYQPDIIKPNLAEFVATFFAVDLPSESDSFSEIMPQIKEKMMELYREYQISTILTRGKDGVIYLNNGQIVEMLAPKIKPINTIGCGDAFTAGFAASWHQENCLEQAVIKGVECAVKNALLMRPGVIK